MKKQQSLLLLLLFTLCLINSHAFAVCKKAVGFVHTRDDSHGVSTGLGRINLSSLDIHPVGTMLSSSIFRLSDNKRYKSPDQILWECDVADKNNIYEIIATNGDERSSGHWEVPGFPGYFYTGFRHIGLKLTHINSGLPFLRNYQRIPMTSYGVSADGKKIQIRVKDFSPIRAEVIRIGTLLPRSGGVDVCGVQETSGPYTCIQPNGYVSFCHPGSGGIAYCDSGDSATQFTGWGHGTWMALNMGTAPVATLLNIPTCVAKNVTPQVVFPSMSVKDLEAGKSATASFMVSIRCEGTAVGGVEQNRTALGLQVAYDSYLAAEKLGLVNNMGGVSYLLSERYGKPNVAGGVGVRIGTAAYPYRFFLGWLSCRANCPMGNNVGWYDAKSDTVAGNTDPKTGIADYDVQFNAVFERVPGQVVTPGKFDAKAYVWVKVQ